jgi:hypothetical protein
MNGNYIRNDTKLMRKVLPESLSLSRSIAVNPPKETIRTKDILRNNASTTATNNSFAQNRETIEPNAAKQIPIYRTNPFLGVHLPLNSDHTSIPGRSREDDASFLQNKINDYERQNINYPISRTFGDGNRIVFGEERQTSRSSWEKEVYFILSYLPGGAH